MSAKRRSAKTARVRGRRVPPSKVAAARRWVAAVNADGSRGRWAYAIVERIADIGAVLAGASRVR